MCEEGRFSDADGDDFIVGPESKPGPPVNLSQSGQRKRRASGAFPWMWAIMGGFLAILVVDTAPAVAQDDAVDPGYVEPSADWPLTGCRRDTGALEAVDIVAATPLETLAL